MSPMDGPRRPEWNPTVRVAQPVIVQLEGGEAYVHLAAVHEARRLLKGSALAAPCSAWRGGERSTAR